MAARPQTLLTSSFVAIITIRGSPLCVAGEGKSPMQGRSGDEIVGTVRNFRVRSEPPPFRGVTIVVWSFQLDLQNGGGSGQPVLVEMRGNSFEGVIDDGDVVAVRARARPREVVQPKEVYNMTKGVMVRASYYRGGSGGSGPPTSGGSYWAKQFMGLLIFLVVAGIFLAIVFFVMVSMSPYM
jgi:hypothetical protein